MKKQIQKIKTYLARKNTLEQIERTEAEIQKYESGNKSNERPVILFVASAHIKTFGLGAAVGLLTSWALRRAGVPVKYYVCQGGLSQCALGSNRQGIYSPPPCEICIQHRNSIYPSAQVTGFKPSITLDELRSELTQLSWEALMSFTQDGVEYGKLCLPSLRWVERRYTLKPDHFTRTMLEEYIFSAVRLARDFSDFLKETRPQAVVAMNGTHFPEAVVRQVALKQGVRVITYESGLRGDTIFFTHGIATEYAIDVPKEFVMGEAENSQLDSYMEKRRRGGVPIAGRNQWSQMTALPTEFLNQSASYRQVVSIFANTVWDTSQAYADRYFNDMFDWLHATLEFTKKSPDTFFVLRAHPDEARFGKESNETVEEWLLNSEYREVKNLFFVAPKTQISSYELIKLSKFCVVYNSTVGLEAALMGKVVLPGGWTRYRNAEACLDINSRLEFEEKMTELLEFDGELSARPVWVENARRFYYFSQFKTAFDFSPLIKNLSGTEYTLLPFRRNAPDTSDFFKRIVDGIQKGTDFVVE